MQWHGCAAPRGSVRAAGAGLSTAAPPATPAASGICGCTRGQPPGVHLEDVGQVVLPQELPGLGLWVDRGGAGARHLVSDHQCLAYCRSVRCPPWSPLFQHARTTLLISRKWAQPCAAGEGRGVYERGAAATLGTSNGACRLHARAGRRAGARASGPTQGLRVLLPMVFFLIWPPFTWYSEVFLCGL